MKRILTVLATVATSLALCANAAAQSYEVKGVIEDPLGPVIGATVLELGTTNGTMTDLDGAYTLKVSSSDAIVEISCIGYTTQTYKASEIPAKVSLSVDTVLLEDVVVIGYGSQKKKEVTSAVASVKSEDFNAGIKTSPVGLLQGKVAGLNVIKTSSDPTSTGYNIQIRGFSTLDKGAGTSPLFIVDGVPVSNIDNISNDEIASMDVLKDGSAAAIYGTRGTNGVIIITTKRGENFSDIATTSVEYSGYASMSVRNGSNGLSTAEEYINLKELSGGAVTPLLYDAEGHVTSDPSQANKTDWMSLVCRPAALTHNHNVAISGSSSKFNYRASINYKNAEGIAKVTNRNELIGKIAASQKALQGWLNLAYDFSYMHYRNDFFCGDFKQVATLNPTYPVYDSNNANGYFKPAGTGESNPIENMNQKESYGDGDYFRGSVKATVNVLPVEGLKINGFAAFEKGNNASYWANKSINTDLDGSGMAGRSNNTSFNKLFELTSDYSHSIGYHHIAAVAGLSYQNFLYDASNMENGGFPSEEMKYYQMGNGDVEKTKMNIGSSRNSHTLAAVFARVNYNYADKYLASVSLRREGSSRFGKNNKWGYFPAVSLGWRVTGEDFMKSVSWVNDLKVRAGFGVTGNDLASDLRSVELLSKGGTFWYNGGPYDTYTVSQNVNPDLRWEKKYEYNFGIDYSLADNRIYGSIDTYFRETRDLLWDYEVPTPPYQYPTLLANAGRMASYGAEFALSFVPVKNNDFTWTTTPTFAINKSYITKLSDPEKGFNYTQTMSGGVGENGIMNSRTQILIEGSPVGAFYGYKFKKFKDDGTWMFSTPQGGVVSEDNATESQMQVLGSAQPWFTYGWNNNLRWKNFDLSVFFRGVIGNKILNVTRWAYGPVETVGTNIFMKDVNKTKTIYSNKTFFSDYYLEDGSYLKLDNITLGYTMSPNENQYISSLRVYLTGQNLLTLTSYSGMDPEVNTTNVWSAGIDYPSFYPKVATILLGINITLK